MSAVGLPSPTPRRERIPALDVLRGFALFGVFVVNASVSARPFEEAVGPPMGGPASEQLAWLALTGLFVTKFVALFSLLFGMGLVLQCDRLERRGGSTVPYRRRLAWLAVLGGLHGFLLFEGDILLPYALVGALLYALRRRSSRFLLATAAAAYAVGLVLEATVGTQALPPDPERDALVLRAHHEGPASLVLRLRGRAYVEWLVVSSVTAFNWQVIALFLVGAVVMRRGLLGREHGRLHRRLALLAIPAGMALEGLALLGGGDAPFAARALGAVSFAVGCLVLAAGYTGAVVHAVHAGVAPRIQHALAAVGRTALTGYLAQSLLMNLLFFWFGLDLYGRMSRAGVLVLVTALFAVQAVAAVLWLRRFPMGPAEWLWRRLTYGATGAG